MGQEELAHQYDFITINRCQKQCRGLSRKNVLLKH